MQQARRVGRRPHQNSTLGGDVHIHDDHPQPGRSSTLREGPVFAGFSVFCRCAWPPSLHLTRAEGYLTQQPQRISLAVAEYGVHFRALQVCAVAGRGPHKGDGRQAD